MPFRRYDWQVQYATFSPTWAPPLNLLYKYKFLNTSEFIIMINSRHILNWSIELIIKPQALEKTSCYKCNGTKRDAAWSRGGGEIFKIFKKIVFKKVLKV
jgi:hypothetical protein